MHQSKTNFIWIGVACIFIVVATFATIPAMGQSAPNVIIVTEADTIRSLNTNQSLALDGLLDQIEKRIVLRFANTRQVTELVPVPNQLDSALDEIGKRIVIRFGNAKRTIDLTTIPSTFGEDLDAISDRIVLRFANSKRQMPLLFPIGMIPDSVAPIISNPTSTLAGGTLTLRWTTDELTSSTFAYGTQAGSYLNMIEASAVSTVHTVEIIDLQPGRYYYQIVSTDRSNNQSQITGSIDIAAQVPTVTPTVAPLPSVTPTATAVPSEPTETEFEILLPFVSR